MTTPLNKALRRLWWVPIGAILVAMVGLSILPQMAPMKINAEYAVVPNPAFAGEPITIERDIDISNAIERKCSATVTKWIEDVNGVIHMLGTSTRSHEDFVRFEKNDPGHVALTLSLPGNIPAGRATYYSKFDFQCTLLHYIVPLTVTLKNDFVVGSRNENTAATVTKELKSIREKIDDKVDDVYKASDARRDWNRAEQRFQIIEKELRELRKAIINSD